MMSEVIDRSTSSPDSAAGPQHSDSRAGRTTGPSGRARARASHSRSRVVEKEPWMNGIYGPTFIDSSKPPDLSDCAVSRLAARLGTLGSMEWRLTWRGKVTPSGRSICRLAPSERPTDGTGSTGWPTPRSSPNENRNTKSAPSHGETHGLTLAGVAHDLSGWATPTSNGEKLSANPTTGMGDHWDRKRGNLLENVAYVKLGTTMRSSDQTRKGSTGALNPEFVSWLMGFPVEWLNYAPSETPSSRKSRRK